MSNSPAELRVAQLSDTGRARSHNEDYVDHYVPQDAQQLEAKGAVYLVADGMGGHQAGEVASRNAVELVIDQYYRDQAHDVGSSLVRAFRAANRVIYDQAQSDPAKGGMGTTLVAAVVVGAKVYVASVGDSRVYIIGPSRIAQITEDHSWVQEQVRAGLLTPEQARQHPQRNVVTRALGSKPSVEIDLFEGQIGEGDALLLCSDGLSGLVEDRELQAVVTSQPPEEAVQTLVTMANERGGTDNITVLIVSNRPPPPRAAATTVPMAPVQAQRSRRPFLIPLLLAVFVLAALAAVALFVLLPALKGEQATATATATSPVSPLPTPTSEATALVTATDLPVALISTPLPATVTLIPSRTATATRGPATQPVQATATEGQALTASPTAIYPPVTLAAPPKEAASLHGVVTFSWSYSRALLAGEAFQVLIWRDGTTEPHKGAAESTTALKQPINLDDILPGRGGPGTYWWTVIVVRVGAAGSEQRLSSEGTPWNFTFTQPGGPGAQQPTATQKIPFATPALPTLPPPPSLFPTHTPGPILTMLGG